MRIVAGLAGVEWRGGLDAVAAWAVVGLVVVHLAAWALPMAAEWNTAGWAADRDCLGSAGIGLPVEAAEVERHRVIVEVAHLDT